MIPNYILQKAQRNILNQFGEKLILELSDGTKKPIDGIFSSDSYQSVVDQGFNVRTTDPKIVSFDFGILDFAKTGHKIHRGKVVYIISEIEEDAVNSEVLFELQRVN